MRPSERTAWSAWSVGGVYKTMGTHVLKHGLSLQDYREKWGDNRQTAFTAPDTHEKMRRHALARNLVALAPPDSLRRAWEVRRLLAQPSRPESRLAHGERLLARYAAGWQPNRPKKVEDETLRVLVGTGLTTREISGRTGLNLRSVSRRLRQLQRRGVAVPRPARPRPSNRRRVTDEQVLAFIREGLRPVEIAARTGIARKTVSWKLWHLRWRGLLSADPPQPGPRN